MKKEPGLEPDWLLCRIGECPLTRFVTLSTGPRTVARTVGSVVGFRRLTDDELQELPPLLHSLDGVMSAFEEIVELVITTEAAREIELSTKQQTTTAEQVNFAVANVTHTTKESETSSTQTLQTASQLAELSHRLRQLVEPVTTG